MRLFKFIRLWIRYRISGFKLFLVRKLGGEVTKYVATPKYRNYGEFSEYDWHELVALPTICAALFRFLNKHIEEMEREKFRLSEHMDNDRKRLKYDAILETYHWFYTIPETALRAIKRIEEERKKQDIKYSNMGENE